MICIRPLTATDCTASTKLIRLGENRKYNNYDIKWPKVEGRARSKNLLVARSTKYFHAEVSSSKACLYFFLMVAGSL